MATEWMIRGVEYGNCNCDYGCPCQFGSPTTHGNCEAVLGESWDWVSVGAGCDRDPRHPRGLG